MIDIHDIAKLIQDVGDTSSSKEKIAMLKKHADNEELVRVFSYALNPFITFGIKKIPAFTESSIKIDTFPWQLLDDLADRNLTGNAAIGAVANVLGKLPDDLRDLFVRVLSKDLKIGVLASNANKAFGKGTIPTYACLLAEKSSNTKAMANIKFPAIVQQKCDGLRINACVHNGKVTYYSRAGNELDIPNESLELAFKYIAGSRDLVYDGELVFYNEDGTPMPRKISNGLGNKAIRGTLSEEEAKHARIILWDRIQLIDFISGQCPTKYQVRFDALISDVGSWHSGDQIMIVPTWYVSDMHSVNELYHAARDRGEEGVMLKNIDHLWMDKRSPDIIKFKALETCDLKIIDIVEGTGALEGMLGSFLMEDATGKLRVNVGIGFEGSLDNKARVEFFQRSYIGYIAEVFYNEVIVNEKGEYSLFLPQFGSIREDKFVADDMVPSK